MSERLSAMDLLLKGGRVIDPANGVDTKADVWIEGGKIARVAPSIPEAEARHVVDVSGYLVMTLRAGKVICERDGLAVPDWRGPGALLADASLKPRRSVMAGPRLAGRGRPRAEGVRFHVRVRSRSGAEPAVLSGSRPA